MSKTLLSCIRPLAPLLVLIWGAASASAHEFWISPEAYQIVVGDPIAADLRVGEKLSGSAYPYIPRNTERFEIFLDGGVQDIESRVGDRPALNQALSGEGLAIVVHETTDLSLTYRNWEKFVAFTTHKDFAWAQDEHMARGLPETDFKEAYRRYAKSLVGVGTGEGADLEVGLDIEIVALKNPYTDDLADGFPVQVLFGGEPRADEQVELFARRSDEDVAVSQIRTDYNGIATLSLQAGTEYLVDSVVMLPIEPKEENGPVWRSLWASLTFKTPEN